MAFPHPRTKNVYMQNGKTLVSRVPHFNGDYLPETVAEAAELLGGVKQSIRPGDSVFLKPNFNCRYAIPLSTHLSFLTAVIELLQDHGARVSVGDSSGKSDGPTADVVRDLRVLPVLKRYGVPFINFDEEEWVDLEVPGIYWKKFRVARRIYDAEKRVYLANVRCHSSARFTASLKLSVGWISMEDRVYLHEDKPLTEWKIADLNLGWQPDLVFIDARRSATGQYGRGPYVYPNAVLASGDMVAVDAEAVKMLKAFPDDNLLKIPFEEMGQFATALKLGLGSLDYTLLEAEGHTETLQKSRF